MEKEHQQPGNQLSKTVTSHAELLVHPTRAITFRDHGFMTAGKNNGDPIAFGNQLRWIYEGHKVDGIYDGGEEQLQKQLLEKEILVKETDLSKLINDFAHLKEVIIVDKQSQIDLNKEEIEVKKIQCAQGKLESKYSPFIFRFYSTLTFFLFVFLILFYTSAINAALFRDMGEIIKNSSSSDILALVTSIFDSKGIFSLSPNLAIAYLGSVLFLSLGILPHILITSRKPIFKISCMILLCLIIDLVLAYKIDSDIHYIKMMIGIADESWIWYRSPNIHLIVVFGFITYLTAGILFEAARKENAKKDVNAVAEIEINGLKLRIRELEKEIIQNKAELKEIQKGIDELRILIDNKRKDLNKTLTKPETLKRNIENFYAGWLQYLNGSDSFETRKIECENIFKAFHQPVNPFAINFN